MEKNFSSQIAEVIGRLLDENQSFNKYIGIIYIAPDSHINAYKLNGEKCWVFSFNKYDIVVWSRRVGKSREISHRPCMEHLVTPMVSEWYQHSNKKKLSICLCLVSKSPLQPTASYFKEPLGMYNYVCRSRPRIVFRRVYSEIQMQGIHSCFFTAKPKMTRQKCFLLYGIGFVTSRNF
jgi:hypothetical protein